MGRSLGVNDSYYRVTIAELLTDYEKAIPLLTIDDTTRLQHRVISLEENQEDIALIELKHQQEMNTMREDMQKEMKQQISELISKLKLDMLIKAIS